MRSRLAIVGPASFFVLQHLVLPYSAEGQTAARDSSAPITTSGFVDTYFSWNFARPLSHANRLRNFDLNENRVVLSAAEIEFQRIPNPVGFHIEASVGSTADITNSGNSETDRLVQQAYLSAILPFGSRLTIDAGKFVTHMGYETIKSKDNANYSRSFLFSWAIPYYHLGVRATYAVLENLTLGLHLCNGWNNSSSNSGKTFGAMASYTPTPKVTLIANWIGGPEEPDSVSSRFRNVSEGIVMVQATEQFGVGLDAVYGSESLGGMTLLWRGVAAYGRFSLADGSFLSARAEVYSDPQGFTTGLPQDLKEVTLTYEHPLLANLLLRAEYRYDWSTSSAFDSDTGLFTRANQRTIVLATIVTF